MSAYGKQANGLEDPRDILGVGAVKAQRRQTQAADNKERVGHIVAKDPWQEQRKAGEQRLREEQCHQCAKGRHEEGKAHLENVGEIHYNIYGNYEFTPYDHKITTPSLYGLDSFEMRELSTLQRKERVLVPANLTKEKKTYEISISRTLLRNAAAMIAVIVMFFAFSTPVENTYVEKNNYAQLLPGELFEQIEKQSVAVTPVSVVAKHNPQNAATSQTKKVSVDKPRTSKPIAVKEIKVAKQETAPATPAVATPATPSVQPQASHPFHIIVAGGIGLKDAEAMAEQLKAKGFAEAKALNSDGKIRVSIRSFENREEATRQLLELRKNETYKNAWLLAK